MRMHKKASPSLFFPGFSPTHPAAPVRQWIERFVRRSAVRRARPAWLDAFSPVEAAGGLTLIALLCLSAWVEWRAICWLYGLLT